MKSVISEPTLCYSPLLVKPFGQLCSLVFHLGFLCIERLREPVGIALEKQGQCKTAQQTGCTKPQDGTINRTQSDGLLRPHLFHQPAVLIIRPLRIDSERGHTSASFLFDMVYPSRRDPLTLKYIMILRGYDPGGRCVPPMLEKRPYFSLLRFKASRTMRMAKPRSISQQPEAREVISRNVSLSEGSTLAIPFRTD